jgi:hypothetical protein
MLQTRHSKLRLQRPKLQKPHSNRHQRHITPQIRKIQAIFSGHLSHPDMEALN